MNDNQQLKTKIQSQVRLMKKADQERPNLLSQTIYIGTLGVVMVLPIIIAAYLGHWLDSLIVGYSMHWTISLLIAGIVIGLFNVYFLIKD